MADEILDFSRERDKLILNIGGIRNLGGLPDILVSFDSVKDKIALLEANKLRIPIISILDTNSDPDIVDYPIPGNDDALRSINLYAELFKTTILEAKNNIVIKEKDVKDSNNLDNKNQKKNQKNKK